MGIYSPTSPTGWNAEQVGKNGVISVFDPCRAHAVGFESDLGAYVYLSDLVDASGVTASTIRKWIAKGQFPKPYGDEFGKHVWLVADLPDWLKVALETNVFS
ncbi:helix-turn-helix transcriptional regulator [Vibrio astriarenae]